MRRRTGVLTENAGLDDRLTTRENLMFTARVRGFSPSAADARVRDLLERFGMADRADDLTQGFSTGQRKRVALARALLHDPEVLFLDEPTSGLDPAGTRDVIDLIGSLASEGRTIVLATHFLGEAGRLADRMAVLHRGQLQAFGRPDELAAELWAGRRRLGRPGTPGRGRGARGAHLGDGGERGRHRTRRRHVPGERPRGAAPRGQRPGGAPRWPCTRWPHAHPASRTSTSPSRRASWPTTATTATTDGFLRGRPTTTGVQP